MVSQKTGKIYVLRDPRTNQVRYVGRTTYDNPNTRLSQHVHSVKWNSKRRTATINWIASLVDLGLKPIMEVIEETALEVVDDREIFWITHYRADPEHHLLNHSNGGTGGNNIVGPRDRSGPVSCLSCQREFPSNFSLRSHYGSKHSGGSQTRSEKMTQEWHSGVRKSKPRSKANPPEICKRGHDMTDNTWISPDGYKWACRLCLTETARNRRRRLAKNW